MAKVNLKKVATGSPASMPVRAVAKRKSASIAAGTAGSIDGRGKVKRMPPGVRASARGLA